MKRKMFVVFAVLMILSLFVSCSAPAAEPTKASEPETASEAAATAVPVEEVKYKDTLVYATAVDQNWMDGQMNNTNDKVLRIVYSGLFGRSITGEVIPVLADTWEVADDGVTWTFTIKKGVKFHNGKELTTRDIKASYDRLMNKDKPVRYSGTVAYLQEVKIVDDYTIQFITKDKYPIMLSGLTHRANLILDADYIEKYGEELGKTVESVNGTGPFKLVQWDINEQQVYERFDDYFAGRAIASKNIG